MKKTKDRQAIPEDVAREVRRRCGFGCVICGSPLYEYEHMLEYAEVQRHVADEMTLLCPTHHAEKTNGLMPKSVVERHNREPFNLRAGVSKPYTLYYEGDAVECMIAGIRIITAPGQRRLVPLTIFGEPMIAFDLADGHFLLSVRLYDIDGTLLLHIDKNELVYSMRPWDISLVGRRLRIREGLRKINIDITFDTPNRIHVRQGLFRKDGFELIIGPDYYFNPSNRSITGGGMFHGIDNALVLGDPRPEGTCGLFQWAQRPNGPLDRKQIMRDLRSQLKEYRATAAKYAAGSASTGFRPRQARVGTFTESAAWLLYELTHE